MPRPGTATPAHGWLLCGAFLAAALMAAPCGAQTLPAFPGAAGFGAHAVGGRGGSVYVVTNLEDSGPGSFRDAVSQPNRYVVFAVGGLVRLNSRVIVASNLTIAGQTAPGEGITLYGNGLSFSNANNTVTRYIRIRMGVVGDSGADAVTIAQGANMVFDHVSVSWGRDETFSVSGTASNITVQDSIIAQGLHPHSAGGLMETSGGVSVVRCLYVDNTTRNPKVKGVNEFVNNVIYNWGGEGAYILGDSAGQSYVNVLENYFIEGPSTGVQPFTRGNLNFHIYASNNYHDANRNGALDGAVIPQSGYTTVDWQTVPFPYPTLQPLPAAEAFAHVLARAGASLSRDRVDRRLIEEVTSLGALGQIMTNESDPPMNGPGPVAGGRPPADGDQDGIPDAWEAVFGLDPGVADHNGDADGNGYTNLEDYLNALVPGGEQTAAVAAVTEDTGLSAADGVTSDDTLTVSGTGAPGGQVVVKRLGVGVVGTVAAGADGAWAFDYGGTTLGEGFHAFTAAGLDPETGPGVPTAARLVKVDRTAPAAPAITSVVLDGEAVIVNGTGEPGGEVEVTLAGSGSRGRAITDEGGLWTVVSPGPPLSPGTHTFTAVTSDAAGNLGPASAPYVVDTTLAAPVIVSVSEDTGASTTDRLTRDTTLVLAGTAVPGTAVTVTRTGAGALGTVPAADDGAWTFDYSGTPLSAGPHTFSATGTGAGGTSSPAAAPFVVTIDTAGPAVSAIRRQDPPTAATVAVPLTFRVTFPEPVSGVGLEDFALTLTGTAAGTATGLTPLDDQTYDVLVSAVAGEGTVRLDLRATGTGIVDRAGNPAPAGFTAGQAYTIRAAGSGVWVTPESGTWSDGARWQQGEVASGPSATADFASLDVTEDVAVLLDGPRSLGHVVFGDTDPATAAGWRLDDGGDAANVLTLAAGVGSPSLTVNPLGTAAVAVVEATLAGTAGLTKAGAGTLVLARANTLEGPLTVGRGTLRLGPGAHLAATTVTVAGNVSELNLAGGTLAASGLATLTPRNSAIVIDAGTARFDGGVTCTNTRDAIFRVRGGTVSASSLDFPRTSDATINFGSGLLIQGGDTVIGPVGLGTVNSWGVMSVEAGALTVTGPLTLGHQVTAGRGGALRVTGGTLRVTDAAHGIVMSRNPGSNPNNVSQASFLGGVSTVERLTLGYDATVTAGSATVTLGGGALYLGAGGIVRNGTGTFAANLNFGSGTLGASAPWGTAVGITLPAGGTVTLKAADVADAPRDIALGGVLAGAGGFTKTGAGALELSGANTFTGPVTVNGGTLRVEGGLSSGEAVAVKTGGRLVGGGTIGRDVLLQGGGTVAPGGAAGPVLTTGAFTWSAGGRLAFDLSAATRLAVAGPLVRGLPGVFEVHLSSSAPLPVGEAFTLASYASTEFTAADLTYSGLPGYRGVLLVEAGALRFLVTGAGASAAYTHWEYLNLPEGEQGAATDPDGDGVANLLEFAVGTDPRQPSGDRTAAATVVVDGETYPALAYVRRQDRGGVAVDVLVSPDLTFADVLEQVEVSVEARGDGTEDVVVRSAAPLSQQPRQFFRVAATLPEE